MRVAAGLLLVASMGAVVATAAHLHGQVASGDVTAGERCEVHVGSRAVAVLEKGAHVVWSGDAANKTKLNQEQAQPWPMYCSSACSGSATTSGC